MAQKVQQHKARNPGDAIVQLAQDWHRRLAGQASGTARADVALRLVHGALVLRTLEVRGVARDGQLGRAARPPDCVSVLHDAFAESRRRFGSVSSLPADAVDVFPSETLSAYVNILCSPATTRLIRAAPVEALGHAYEQCLGNLLGGGTRKAGGVYYTPRVIVERLVDQTLGALLTSSPELEPATLRAVDPACGAGAFLLGAYDRLLAAQLAYVLRLSPSARRGRLRVVRSVPALTGDERRRVLEACIFGVDLDEHALEVARLCLQLRMLDGDGPPQLDLFGGGATLPALAGHLRVGNSLARPRTAADRPGATPAEPDRAFSWGWAFPRAIDGFDVVIGNPPWGQKAVDVDDAFKQRIRDTYPSSRGIFDWFRPFVELGVRLTRAGGAWGMVLPDIVLLKNYEPTRRLLLDELAMTDIEWLGMAFSGATIDAVTIAGRKEMAAADHRVHVVVSEPGNDVDHWIRQADFARNPRSVFNLLLTDDKRACLDKLASAPRLGDFFEVHEGIHSGNIRSDLFVDSAVDESCRELLFGRDELRPYAMRWNGRYARLSALPVKRTRERYANLGQRGWYEQEKILVRRTGDRITAAVEPNHRYASNNFFVIIAKRAHPLSLHGLCALLNSALSTWWFRTVEPRKGRAFAEVKIKHLTALPVPETAGVAACQALNVLGAERALATDDRASTLDARIDAAVLALFDLESTPEGVPNAKALPDRRTA